MPQIITSNKERQGERPAANPALLAPAEVIKANRIRKKEHESLLSIATAARRFIEPIWLEWHKEGGCGIPDVMSKGTCGRTSLFLQRVLRHQGFDAQWICGVPQSAAGKHHENACGFFSGQTWESHAWAVSRLQGSPELTAGVSERTSKSKRILGS